MWETDESFPEIRDRAQARGLADLLELQARRESLWANPPNFPDTSQERLQVRDEHEQLLREVHELWDRNLQGYSDRYCPPLLTQRPLNTPATLGAWCRLVVRVYRALGPDAEGVVCGHVMAKAARWARKVLPPGPEPVRPDGECWTIPVALAALESLARQCQGLPDR